MVSRPDTKKARAKRHKRVRSKISGTASCPRLCVFRSTSNIYAQIIDDVAGVTLAQASSLDKEITGNGGNKEAAKAVGKLVAERAKEKNIVDVVFDRGGNIYHGRVKELAEQLVSVSVKQAKYPTLSARVLRMLRRTSSRFHSEVQQSLTK